MRWRPAVGGVRGRETRAQHSTAGSWELGGERFGGVGRPAHNEVRRGVSGLYFEFLGVSFEVRTVQNLPPGFWTVRGIVSSRFRAGSSGGVGELGISRWSLVISR
jgi:hypothetical protein